MSGTNGQNGHNGNGARPGFADKIDMQNRLFAELSRMFGSEVPLYDKSLAVNGVCNRAVCDLLAKKHVGFAISDEQLDKTSGERHGAIRIGRPDEYKWIARFFACFAMEPHNYYDMTSVGSKSQPITATAFRATLNPEHRVFTSLLQTDYFSPETKTRIDATLAKRQVFSAAAKSLIEKSERQGGLDWNDADALIKEATGKIFKWTGKARDHGLYKDLCDAGFKIAADIACFENHHLNHLTPNTFCMDLYTAAMKFALGEMDEATFRSRAELALGRLLMTGDRDYVRLCFRHFSREQIESFGDGHPSMTDVNAIVDAVVKKLKSPELDLSKLKHAGFKDFTEGPSEDTPILLRQDAYKALSEPVAFANDDGTTTNAVHTARFGEIEQRGYACTPKGRKLYDECLAQADAARDKDPSLPKKDFDAYEKLYAAPFKPFPKTLQGLLDEELIYGLYSPTAEGLAARGSIDTTDVNVLVKQGYARVEGLRYEDFLPVSAAGIFASNLNQYGTKSTAANKPDYPQSSLESVIGRPIIDTDKAYRGLWAESVIVTLSALGLMDKLPADQQTSLRGDAKFSPISHGGARSPQHASV